MRVGPPIFIADKGRVEWPLPRGWTWSNLVELADLESGHTPRKTVSEYWEGGDVPWISLRDIRAADGKVILSTEKMPTALGIENSSARLLPQGTVVFSRDISVGWVAIMGTSMATTQHFANWVCSGALYNQYLMQAFRASRADLLTSGEGTTVSTIYMPALKRLRVSLPPLNEQKRIVAKIDALTEKSREAREALDEVPVLLDMLRQSILDAAFRGDLTRKWREQNPDVEPASVLLDRIRTERRRKWEEAELAKFQAKGKVPKGDEWKFKYKEPEPVDTEGLPELPEGWCWASLEEACPLEAPVVYGIIQPGPQHPGGIPYIRPIDMTWEGAILSSSVRLTSPEIAAQYSRSELREGDIILSIVGTIGKVAITPPAYSGANITQSAVRIRPPKGVSSELLSDMLRSPPLIAQFDRFRFGNAVQRLNVEHARALAIPLMPAEEARELETALAKHLSTLSALSGASCRDELDRLDSTILAKAFRGELVPQDPSDEPASVLLERIRTERETAGSKKKTSKKGQRSRV